MSTRGPQAGSSCSPRGAEGRAYGRGGAAEFSEHKPVSSPAPRRYLEDVGPAESWEQLSLPLLLRDLSERSLTLASNCRGRRGRPVLTSGAARWTLGTAQLQDSGGLGPHRGRHRPPPMGGVLDHGEGATGQQDTDRALGFSTSRIREKANSCDI